MPLTIDGRYIITYSNHFYFEGRLLAFRKKELYDLTTFPVHVKRTIQGWWLGRKLLSPKTAEKLVLKEPVEKDVTECQWYQQIQLEEVI